MTSDGGTETEATSLPLTASGTLAAESVPDLTVSSDPTADECLVCSDAKRDTLFRPCGHICCCNVCAARVKYKK